MGILVFCAILELNAGFTDERSGLASLMVLKARFRSSRTILVHAR
jgi:hypothetical protein